MPSGLSTHLCTSTGGRPDQGLNYHGQRLVENILPNWGGKGGATRRNLIVYPQFVGHKAGIGGGRGEALHADPMAVIFWDYGTIPTDCGPE